MTFLEEFSTDWMRPNHPESRGFEVGIKDGEAFQAGENVSKRGKQMVHNWSIRSGVAESFC